MKNSCFVVFLLAFIAALTGCSHKSNGLVVERILDSKNTWGGAHAKDPEKRKEDNVQIACLGNVQYIYLHRSFMGGLSPLYKSGALVPCTEEVRPQNGRYMFYLVCHEEHLYYQLANIKGTSLSIALNLDGSPKGCTPDD